MTIKTLAAAALAITVAAPASAVPIELDLTFDSVTVTFFGLDDETAGPQAATSFLFVGALDDYSAGDTSLSSNVFSFGNGSLATIGIATDGSFVQGLNFVGALIQLICDGSASVVSCLSQEFDNPQNTNFIRFGPASVEIRPLLAPVPLPAGGLLLLSALAGAAALKRRKKRSA